MTTHNNWSEDPAHLISVEEALSNEGLTLEDCLMGNTGTWGVPATCSHSCTVDPDGTCPHGHESVLLAVDII